MSYKPLEFFGSSHKYSHNHYSNCCEEIVRILLFFITCLQFISVYSSETKEYIKVTNSTKRSIYCCHEYECRIDPEETCLIHSKTILCNQNGNILNIYPEIIFTSYFMHTEVFLNFNIADVVNIDEVRHIIINESWYKADYRPVEYFYTIKFLFSDKKKESIEISDVKWIRKKS